MMSSVLSMRCLSVAAVVLWMNVSCWSADWTQFLGSDGSGVSSADNLPVRWSETEHIAWKVPVAGKGWSSPVVRGDRIFLTTAIPAGEGDAARQALHTICLEAATGSTLWDVEVFRHADGEAVEMHQKNSHASPTPILEGDHLYVHFGPHGTACLTLDGTVVWKNQELIYAPQHGNGGSPAVAGNLLIICCDGKDIQYVAGLDRQTGKVVWKTDRDTDPQKGFSFCTPTIIHVNGQPQAVCPGSSAVFAYDPATGAEIWRVDYGDGYSVVPRPVFAHGLVYVCSGFGDERLFAIDPTGKGNVTATHVRWSTRKSTPKSPSAIVVGEFVFMVSDAGVASCLNAVSGEQLWQQRLGGGFSASPLAAGRHVYFLSEDGKTTVARIGPEYEEVATSQVGDGNTRTFASFAVLGSSLLLRSESHLYRIEE